MTAPEKTVAVVGASADRNKFSNKSIRAHAQQGWHVFPVNPKGGEIEGLPTYPNLQAIPAASLQRVTMYVPPTVGIGLLEEIAERSPTEFFVNPGAESPELVERARALGLEPILACSIVELGVSPAEFP